MNIHAFTPGQTITRTQPVEVKKPAYYNSNLGMTVEQDPDYSFTFVGQPCVFLGIANGGINIKTGDSTYMLPLHENYNADWSEGWEVFVDLGQVASEDTAVKPKRDKRELISAAYMALPIAASIASEYRPNEGLGWVSAFICGLMLICCLDRWRLGS